MAEDEALHAKIIADFKKRASRGQVMLTIPVVSADLKVDRRKVETALAVLSKAKDPRLVEVAEGRVKYYTLKDIVDFCRERWGAK